MNCKYGDRLIDNDPRMKGRKLTVMAVGYCGKKQELTVDVQDRMGRRFSILQKRIHDDGRPRRSGFTLEAV